MKIPFRLALSNITFQSRFRRSLVMIVFAVLVIELPQLVSDTTAATSFVANMVFRNNLHEVTPGEFFRSAELKEGELNKIVNEKQIKTIVDLRFNPLSPTDQGNLERDAVQSLGVQYESVPLRGTREPDKLSVTRLLEIYRSAPKPILVHCASGTHRSGLASAIWLLSQHPAEVDEAKEQLSAKYGFFRVEREIKSFLQGHSTIDAFLWRFAEANAQTGIEFEQWFAGYSPDVPLSKP